MAEYTDREKIKTCFAQIIVNSSEDKPYYSIMYWENGEMNIGFSSYNLDYVRRWLNEEFEVKHNANVVPVVHGWWNADENCSVCGENSTEGLDATKWNYWLPDYCPHCGAKMDMEVEDDG